MASNKDEYPNGFESNFRDIVRAYRVSNDKASKLAHKFCNDYFKFLSGDESIQALQSIERKMELENFVSPDPNIATAISLIQKVLQSNRKHMQPNQAKKRVATGYGHSATPKDTQLEDLIGKALNTNNFVSVGQYIRDNQIDQEAVLSLLNQMRSNKDLTQEHLHRLANYYRTISEIMSRPQHPQSRSSSRPVQQAASSTSKPQITKEEIMQAIDNAAIKPSFFGEWGGTTIYKDGGPYKKVSKTAADVYEEIFVRGNKDYMGVLRKAYNDSIKRKPNRDKSSKKPGDLFFFWLEAKVAHHNTERDVLSSSRGMSFGRNDS